jgi:hypothetical protein
MTFDKKGNQVWEKLGWLTMGDINNVMLAEDDDYLIGFSADWSRMVERFTINNYDGSETYVDDDACTGFQTFSCAARLRRRARITNQTSYF